jgi:hypothetical protein
MGEPGMAMGQQMQTDPACNRQGEGMGTGMGMGMGTGTGMQPGMGQQQQPVQIKK